MSPPRHLKKGDDLPPATPGKLRIYIMQYCPFSLRVRLMLAKHNVSFEQINIDLSSKPDWYLEKYPIGTVPVMEIDDKLLGGSLIVAEYIDEVYGNGRRTLSPDPFERARTNMLIADKFAKAISSVYQRLWRRENWRESINENLAILEEELKSKPFFAGDKITYADYMIWPWMRLLDTVAVDVLPEANCKNIEKWIDEMKKDETVMKCQTAPDILRKWAKGFETGTFEVDLE